MSFGKKRWIRFNQRSNKNKYSRFLKNVEFVKKFHFQKEICSILKRMNL